MYKIKNITDGIKKYRSLGKDVYAQPGETIEVYAFNESSSFELIDKRIETIKNTEVETTSE